MVHETRSRGPGCGAGQPLCTSHNSAFLCCCLLASGAESSLSAFLQKTRLKRKRFNVQEQAPLTLLWQITGIRSMWSLSACVPSLTAVSAKFITIVETRQRYLCTCEHQQSVPTLCMQPTKDASLVSFRRDLCGYPNMHFSSAAVPVHQELLSVLVYIQ